MPSANISQKVLIDQFLLYVNIERLRARRKLLEEQGNIAQTVLAGSDPLPPRVLPIKKNFSLTEKEKANYGGGFCYGFSVMHSYKLSDAHIFTAPITIPRIDFQISAIRAA